MVYCIWAVTVSLIIVSITMTEIVANPVTSSKLDAIIERLQGTKVSRVSMRRHVRDISKHPAVVCKMQIKRGHRPIQGYDNQGNMVEVRQDLHYSFIATFVECETENCNCHGINNTIYSGECVTEYDLQLALIRPVDSTDIFRLGLLRVPIACQCQLNRLNEIRK